MPIAPRARSVPTTPAVVAPKIRTVRQVSFVCLGCARPQTAAWIQIVLVASYAKTTPALLVHKTPSVPETLSVWRVLASQEPVVRTMNVERRFAKTTSVLLVQPHKTVALEVFACKERVERGIASKQPIVPTVNCAKTTCAQPVSPRKSVALEKCACRGVAKQEIASKRPTVPVAKCVRTMCAPRARKTASVLRCNDV